MAVGPLLTTTLERTQDTVASAGVQSYTLTIKNNDPTNTVKFTVAIPLTRYEGTRAFTSAGTGTSGNTASGSVGIADTVTLSAGVNNSVVYTILSTLTLPTGITFGTSTLGATIQVTERPSGTGVTEAAKTLMNTTYIGDTTLSTFGLRRNEKNARSDEQQIAFRGLGIMDSEVHARKVIDELEEGPKTAWQMFRNTYFTGSYKKVTTVGAAYTVQEDDGMVIGTTTLTITMPSATAIANKGRQLIIKNSHAANTVTLSGTISDSITTVVAAKARMFVCDGTTWQSVGVIA